MDSQEGDDWTDLVTNARLSRRVTLEEYFAGTLELVRKGLVAQSRVDQDRAHLEARTQTGDEWWEWVLGSAPLMQMGGLALVRAGTIVWARLDWIS